MNPIHTIGHSTHPIERFLELLAMHGIEALGDVRSAPYSRFNPQFNREALASSATNRGIRYVFLGNELGACSSDPSCYEQGRVRYALLTKSLPFQAGIERVLEGAKRYRIALMCAEKDPLQCHRTLLVARALADRGTEVQHIHADGHLEPHADAMDRLLDLTGTPRQDLFRSPQELLEEALLRQEEAVAYVDRTLASPTVQEESP